MRGVWYYYNRGINGNTNIRFGDDRMYKPMEEIQREYDGLWVFMINCNKNERGSIIGGEVVLQSKSMGEILRNMVSYDKSASSTYVRYIGELPEGVALLL